MSLPSRFTELRAVAQGGSAQTWAAFDTQTQQSVVVKCWDAAALSQQERTAVQRECEIHRLLSPPASPHPHIVGFVACSTRDEPDLWLATSAWTQTLESVLSSRRPEWSEALRLSQDLLEGLHHLHRRGIVHADIAPQNIVVHNGRAALCDLGLAVDADHPRSVAALGTPGYVAPELVSHTGQPGRHTTRSDVYSAAAVISELLAGTPLPPQVEHLLHDRCQSSLASDRPADALELSQELARVTRAPVVGGSVVETPKSQASGVGESATEKSGREHQSRVRRRWLALLAGLGVLVLALGILSRVDRGASPTAASPSPKPSPALSHCVVEGLCVPQNANRSTALRTIAAVPGATRAPQGPGPWESVVLNTAELGLFVRDGFTSTSSTHLDPHSASGKMSLPEGTHVMVRCRVTDGWLARAGWGRTWYRIQFDAQPATGQYWVYGYFLFPVAHNGLIRTCSPSERAPGGPTTRAG